METLAQIRLDLIWKVMERSIYMETVDQRGKEQSLILLFKCLNNSGPKYVGCFSFRETTYNLRGTSIILCAPKFNQKNAFTYMCV